MPASLGETEVLDAGPPHAPSRPWWRRRGALTGALLALAAAGIVVASSQGGPPPPPATSSVTVFITPAETLGDPTQTGWEPRTDGRPVGPLGLDLPVRFALPAGEDRTVTVLGLTGPGVTSGPDATPATLTSEAPVARRVLHATVDCTALPHPLPADAFGLRVSTSGGPPQDAALAPAPGLPAGPAKWSDVVREGCAGWEAAAYVTLSAVTARVSDDVSEVALSATLTNSGPRPALVARTAAAASVDGPARSEARVRIDSGGTAVVSLVQRFDPCGTARRFMPLQANSRELLGLVALSGDSVAEPDAEERAAGVSVEPAAQQEVLAAYAQACGGVEDVLALTPPGSVRYAGDVTVHLAVDVTPGTVARLRLRTGFVRGWTITPAVGPWLVPDRSGQVRTTIRYGPDQRPAPCELPSALDVDVVPLRGHRGTLAFRTYLLPQGEADTLAAQCLAAR